MTDGGPVHAPARTRKPAPATPAAATSAGRAGTAASGVSGLTVLRAGIGSDVLGGTEASADTASALARLAGGGSPLPEAIASQFGEAMGADLSAVRIHADPEADQISRSLQATAFTHGQDIYFTQGAYSPGTPGGQQLLAHELAHVTQQQTGVQRSASGSGPVVGLAADPAEAQADAIADTTLDRLRRHATDRHSPEVVEVHGGGLEPLRRRAAPVNGVLRRKVVKMGKNDTESVEVADDVEEAEARKIIDELATKYGIDVSSPATVDAVRDNYSDEAAELLEKIETTAWQLRELRAILAAAAHYGPILGGERASSSMVDKVQGVTTVGHANATMDPGELDFNTMGQNFAKKSNVGFFDKNADMVDKEFVRPGKKKKADVETSLEATAIHEMAHALIQPTEIGNWVATLGFWKDIYKKSGKFRSEAPPTSYGRTNAKEDLCESVSMFFINRQQLKKKCPKREKFIADMVARWTPPVKEKVVETTVGATGSEPAPDGPKELVGAK